MHNRLAMVVLSIALAAAVPVAAGATQANAHHKRVTGQHAVSHSGSDITSFSSSSVLHVGVNHPPKNR
jgi:type II secretory pathway pseudopilin PulG